MSTSGSQSIAVAAVMFAAPLAATTFSFLHHTTILQYKVNHPKPE